jgi:excinuclease UvrABC helicase subunit UvrB
MKKQEKYEILAKFVGLFEEKNWILAKFLVDNNAINESFLKKIDIKNLQNKPIDFEDLESFNNYLSNLINKKSQGKEINLEERLLELIRKEKYEEAAKVRDMIKKVNNKNDSSD